MADSLGMKDYATGNWRVPSYVGSLIKERAKRKPVALDRSHSFAGHANMSDHKDWLFAMKMVDGLFQPFHAFLQK
jgi:hypothetical protein